MRIRKWDGSAWTPISPKVTYTDVVADVTAGSPVSIFPSGKLNAAYLPDFVFGGMRFQAAIGSQTDASFANNLDAVYQAVGTNNIQAMVGSYFIATTSFTLQMNSVDQAGSTGRYYNWDSTRETEEDTPDGSDLVVEHGDWIVIQTIGGSGTSGSPYAVSLTVVNNTYQEAASGSYGVIKIGYSENGKNYPVELDGSGKAFVNVPWTDTDTDTNTFRTVTAGGNTLGATENLDFVAGSNISITESGGDVTIASSHPSISAASSVNNSGRTYIQDITLDSNGHITGITSATETVTNTDTNTVTSIRRDNTGTYRTGNINLVGGSNVTITETSAGVFSFASTDTNTNTTYSAGNGIALSGTTFSVAGGVGLTQESSGLKSTYPVAVSSSEPASGFRVTNGALWFDLS